MNKYKTIILYILMICWMIIIFCFSHQGSVQSSATSHQAIDIILNILNITDLDFDKKQELINTLQLPIRKLAHFTLYLVGGIIIYLLFNTSKYSNGKKIGLAFLVATGYAIFDECHQAFVPGRVAQITDVCIDSLGALTGIMITILIINLMQNIRYIKSK